MSSAAQSIRRSNFKTEWILALMLVVITVGAFGGVIRYDFVNYDDNKFVTGNTTVRAGITGKSVAWAFCCVKENWHPLTWLSHLTDVEMYGMNPAGHHFTSLLLHMASTLLLFFFLRSMTKNSWRSVCVAALFAIHPLHAESVAWVAERKDTLSAFFWMLTLCLYAWYATQKKSRFRYAMVLLAFAGGLMSKSMVVTLPFVLLLLDYWPLRRFEIREKIPFFFLAAVIAAVAVIAQRAVGAVQSLEILSLVDRVGNAIVSCVSYLGKMIWPYQLSCFYVHPGSGLPRWLVAAGVVLAGITWIAWRERKRFAYGIVGWLWYLGTLVPVLGLVQVGSQGMADRYTYIPSIGIFIAAVWGLGDLWDRWRLPRRLQGLIALAIVLLLMGVARVQAATWRDSATLFRHALDVDANNWVARSNLASALVDRGQFSEALEQYRSAETIAPGDANFFISFGYALEKSGDLLGAEDVFRKALTLEPGNAKAHFNLGLVLAKQGKENESAFEKDQARQLDGCYVAIESFNRGNDYCQAGKWDDAIAQYLEAIRLNPNNAQFHNNLGIAYARKVKWSEAMGAYEQALQRDPFYVDAHYNQALSLLHLSKKEEAIRALNQALKIDPKYEPARKALGISDE